MHKVAQAITAFMAITGFVAMCLLFAALGLTSYQHGTTNTTMAKDVAFVIGISKFQLGVYSAITMVVSFFVLLGLSSYYGGMQPLVKKSLAWFLSGRFFGGGA